MLQLPAAALGIHAINKLSAGRKISSTIQKWLSNVWDVRVRVAVANGHRENLYDVNKSLLSEALAFVSWILGGHPNPCN